MQELKKKVDYWQVVFTVTTAVGGVAGFIKIIYRLFSVKGERRYFGGNARSARRFGRPVFVRNRQEQKNAF